MFYSKQINQYVYSTKSIYLSLGLGKPGKKSASLNGRKEKKLSPRGGGGKDLMARPLRKEFFLRLPLKGLLIFGV